MIVTSAGRDHDRRYDRDDRRNARRERDRDRKTTTGTVTGAIGRPALERKGPIKMEALDPTAWRSRCAQRMAALDPDLTRSEAERLAMDVYAFERTRAMEPEAAAEFVSIEMSRPERAPFERRSVPRGREAGVV